MKMNINGAEIEGTPIDSIPAKYKKLIFSVRKEGAATLRLESEFLPIDKEITIKDIVEFFEKHKCYLVCTTQLLLDNPNKPGELAIQEDINVML